MSKNDLIKQHLHLTNPSRFNNSNYRLVCLISFEVVLPMNLHYHSCEVFSPTWTSTICVRCIKYTDVVLQTDSQWMHNFGGGGMLYSVHILVPGKCLQYTIRYWRFVTSPLQCTSPTFYYLYHLSSAFTPMCWCFCLIILTSPWL